MARLSSMPEEAIISAFKGVVDFYLWKGIPCARMWPHWPARDPHPDEKLNQDAFAYINTHLFSMPEFLLDQYKRMAASTPLTWKDLAVKAYMKGLNY
ncbi:unnamed protein product [marine sediment metagenome]|uniref:Uncharacterized protein n=1 Tax=marine sediment metagenome TaxID=412755 RepID=X1JZQ9_9ZZZZ